MQKTILRMTLKDLPDYFYIKIVNEKRRKLLFDKAIAQSGGLQLDLAFKLGIDRRRVAKWYYGRRFMPFNYFKILCSIANLTIKFFEKEEIAIKGGKYCRNFLVMKFPFTFTKEWLWMSQIINTDGHINPKRKTIEISNTDKGVLEKIENFCRKIRLEKSLYQRKHNDNGILFVLCNKTLTNIFIEFLGCSFGSKFRTIEISPKILNLTQESLAAAVRGAFDGDGWVCIRSRRVGIAMGSEKYIKQISQVLKSRFFIKNKVYGPRERKFTCEILSLRYLVKFQKQINFDNFHRRDALIETINLLNLSYQKRFHPNCALYECLKIINYNCGINSKIIALTLKRQQGSIRQILHKLRNKELVLYTKKGKEFIYEISPKGIIFMEDFQ